jgi:hypothetical protein
MIKVKSLKIREIEYSYEKRPEISGMDDVIKAVRPMIADANKEFFIAGSCRIKGVRRFHQTS